MTTKIHAIYRNGVLLPDSPIPIAEGAGVELTLTVDPVSAVAHALEEIACLPAEGPRDGFSGADHDKVLYGMRNSQ